MSLIDNQLTFFLTKKSLRDSWSNAKVWKTFKILSFGYL